MFAASVGWASWAAGDMGQSKKIGGLVFLGKTLHHTLFSYWCAPCWQHCADFWLHGGCLLVLFYHSSCNRNLLWLFLGELFLIGYTFIIVLLTCTSVQLFAVPRGCSWCTLSVLMYWKVMLWKLCFFPISRIKFGWMFEVHLNRSDDSSLRVKVKQVPVEMADSSKWGWVWVTAGLDFLRCFCVDSPLYWGTGLSVVSPQQLSPKVDVTIHAPRISGYTDPVDKLSVWAEQLAYLCSRYTVWSDIYPTDA